MRGGSGLGRVLMLQLIAEARQRGAREVFLEVRADNQDAQALYRSLGFAPLVGAQGLLQGRDRRDHHALGDPRAAR